MSRKRDSRGRFVSSRQVNDDSEGLRAEIAALRAQLAERDAELAKERASRKDAERALADLRARVPLPRLPTEVWEQVFQLLKGALRVRSAAKLMATCKDLLPIGRQVIYRGLIVGMDVEPRNITSTMPLHLVGNLDLRHANGLRGLTVLELVNRCRNIQALHLPGALLADHGPDDLCTALLGLRKLKSLNITHLPWRLPGLRFPSSLEELDISLSYGASSGSRLAWLVDAVEAAPVLRRWSVKTFCLPDFAGHPRAARTLDEVWWYNKSLDDHPTLEPWSISLVAHSGLTLRKVYAERWHDFLAVPSVEAVEMGLAGRAMGPGERFWEVVLPPRLKLLEFAKLSVAGPIDRDEVRLWLEKRPELRVRVLFTYATDLWGSFDQVELVDEYGIGFD
ncbi:hypothetical protein DFJ74DRAFT_700953 [Hyaloraphidium curvatum]|nr:hypothetical protein DFJ74DRAFT_700953 [Hyaloraphidium curvatum]